MIIIDNALLRTARSLRCEYCDRLCGYPTERHHIVPRGMGGGNRLDVAENLVDLGGAFDCRCHEDAQKGVITKKELFCAAGRRLGTSGLKCKNKVNKLLRAPKGTTKRSSKWPAG